MYKLKTKKSVRKRFSVSTLGKLLRHKACKSHLLLKKASKRKYRLCKVVEISAYEKSKVLKSLPYL